MDSQWSFPVVAPLMSCRSPTLHEAISRGGDYSTLKGDLAESCLRGYYVTLSTRMATWPQGSPVFRMTIWPSPSKAPLQHTDMLKRPPRVNLHLPQLWMWGGIVSVLWGRRGSLMAGNSTEMCKRMTNTGLATNYHVYVLYLLPIFFLVTQVHQQIILPMCGWGEVKLGLHLCWHLRRFSVRQGERNTQTCRQNE